MEKHPFDNGELEIRDEILAAIPRRPDEIKKHIREYYAMISHVDKRVGNIIQTLKDNGLYENTIIIFAGDNGLAVGQHGLMGKQNVYEHSVGVPLMIKAAAQHTGKKTADLCYLIDVFPTLCDMLQLPVPQSVDGISLLSSLDGKEPVRDYLYYSYMDNQRGISDGTWKLYLALVVKLHVFIRHAPRVMGRHIGYRQEERLVFIFLLLNIFDGFMGENIYGMLS